MARHQVYGAGDEIGDGVMAAETGDITGTASP